MNFRFISLYGGLELRWVHIPPAMPAGVGVDGSLGLPPELVILDGRYYVYGRGGYYLEVQPTIA